VVHNDFNMKGFLIGNPGINSDWYYNVNEYAFQTFLWSHALLPQTAWLKSNSACDWNDFLTNCTKDYTHPDDVCSIANNEAYAYVPQVIDFYDIYAPTCHSDSYTTRMNGKIGKNGRSGKSRVKQYTPFLYKKFGDDYVYNPCMSEWTPEYMNRNDVLQAIHALDHYTMYWPNKPDNWTYGSEMDDIATLFPYFFQVRPEWRISVISGDADSAVPFLDSQQWIECLGRPIVQDWNNWYLNGDVAGSVKVFDGITFLTVKDCGHTIPTYCPEQGFLFLQQFLNGTYSSN